MTRTIKLCMIIHLKSKEGEEIPLNFAEHLAWVARCEIYAQVFGNRASFLPNDVVITGADLTVEEVS